MAGVYDSPVSVMEGPCAATGNTRRGGKPRAGHAGHMRQDQRRLPGNFIQEFAGAGRGNIIPVVIGMDFHSNEFFVIVTPAQ